MFKSFDFEFKSRKKMSTLWKVDSYLFNWLSEENLKYIRIWCLENSDNLTNNKLVRLFKVIWIVFPFKLTVHCIVAIGAPKSVPNILYWSV